MSGRAVYLIVLVIVLILAIALFVFVGKELIERIFIGGLE